MTDYKTIGEKLQKLNSDLKTLKVRYRLLNKKNKLAKLELQTAEVKVKDAEFAHFSYNQNHIAYSELTAKVRYSTIAVNNAKLTVQSLKNEKKIINKLFISIYEDIRKINFQFTITKKTEELNKAQENDDDGYADQLEEELEELEEFVCKLIDLES